MVFSSPLFLFYFFPAFILLYSLCPKRFKNACILIFSIIFYAWGAPKFIFILMGSTILDFYIVKALYNATTVSRKKLWISISISMNVGLLVYFKYANFFVENVNLFLSKFSIEAIGWTEVLLPIGISFYTFQTLTYSIDIYRGVYPPQKKLSNYLLYIMSFPQMIAGPIVRYQTIAAELTDREDSFDDKLVGFTRFSIGLAKKVLIANVMGRQADIIFANQVSDLDCGFLWMGILAYTFQIYFDFSGYSDMAIGLGRMMGFHFPENFNLPYLSRSISEFWRRWHITLGTFMRDYLYIPLGGNQVNSKFRLYFNLVLVFLISGLWHGASWNFVIWGAYHGLFLILDRLFLLKVYEKIGRIASNIITFIIVVIGWVFFRVEEFSVAIEYIKGMFDFSNFAFPGGIPSFYPLFVIGIIFAFFDYVQPSEKLKTYFYEAKDLSRSKAMIFVSLALVLLIVSSADLLSSGFNPFIYFRF